MGKCQNSTYVKLNPPQSLPFMKLAMHHNNLLKSFILTVSNATVLQLNHILASSTMHPFN